MNTIYFLWLFIIMYSSTLVTFYFTSLHFYFTFSSFLVNLFFLPTSFSFSLQILLTFCYNSFATDISLQKNRTASARGEKKVSILCLSWDFTRNYGKKLLTLALVLLRKVSTNIGRKGSSIRNSCLYFEWNWILYFFCSFKGYVTLFSIFIVVNLF